MKLSYLNIKNYKNKDVDKQLLYQLLYSFSIPEWIKKNC